MRTPEPDSAPPRAPDGHERAKAPRAQGQSSEFLDSLRTGVLVGVVLLAVIVPMRMMQKAHAPQPASEVATASPAESHAAPQRAPGVRLADFRGEQPSVDARIMANWVLTTGDAQRHAFVLVDKKDARVYVFAPDGTLEDSAPALLGAARGDDSFPGIGDKPLSAVKPEEKTTPAGRFVAEPGINAGNEDVVWVSYDLAVSMHRIRPFVVREHRLERLATLTTDDNRISFGCINLPVSFYENVLSPTVHKHGAIIYVLPEVKTAQQVFGAYDVTDPDQIAAARKPQKLASAGQGGMEKVSLPAR